MHELRQLGCWNGPNGLIQLKPPDYYLPTYFDIQRNFTWMLKEILNKVVKKYVDHTHQRLSRGEYTIGMGRGGYPWVNGIYK